MDFCVGFEVGFVVGVEVRKEFWFWDGNVIIIGFRFGVGERVGMGFWILVEDVDEDELSRVFSFDIEEISLRFLFWVESENSNEFRFKSEKDINFERKVGIKDKFEVVGGVDERFWFRDGNENRSEDKFIFNIKVKKLVELRGIYLFMVLGVGMGLWVGVMIWTEMKFLY